MAQESSETVKFGDRKAKMSFFLGDGTFRRFLAPDFPEIHLTSGQATGSNLYLGTQSCREMRKKHLFAHLISDGD